MIYFTEKKVSQLRESVQQAVMIPDCYSKGWFKSPVDPMKLLSCFPKLSLRKGYTLKGYLFRAEGNGNGIIWAIPEDAEFPEPGDCIKLEDHFLLPPKPEGALDDIMEAIKGDGSPWSYLSASVFKREAMEFGALWHGCDWADNEIIGKEKKIRFDNKEWNWKEGEPKVIGPHVFESSGEIQVQFFTYQMVGSEKIIRNTDRYTKNSYRFKTERETVAYGSAEIIY